MNLFGMTKPQKAASQNGKDKQQVAAFRKAARELGADATDERFKDVLRTVAKAKPSPEKGKQRRD
jgi:hypothetical protein